MDVLSILLDPNNNEPIILTDEDGQDIPFKVVAVVNIDDCIHTILYPSVPIEGIDDDMAFVFRCVILGEGESTLELVDDEVIIARVFMRYRELLEEQSETPEVTAEGAEE